MFESLSAAHAVFYLRYSRGVFHFRDRDRIANNAFRRSPMSSGGAAPNVGALVCAEISAVTTQLRIDYAEAEASYAGQRALERAHKQHSHSLPPRGGVFAAATGGGFRRARDCAIAKRAR